MAQCWYRSTERKKKRETDIDTEHTPICDPVYTDTNQQITAAPNHSLIKPSLDQIPVLNPTINQNLEY